LQLNRRTLLVGTGAAAGWSLRGACGRAATQPALREGGQRWRWGPGVLIGRDGG
jgi:hypothetical protein